MTVLSPLTRAAFSFPLALVFLLFPLLTAVVLMALFRLALAVEDGESSVESFAKSSGKNLPLPVASRTRDV